MRAERKKTLGGYTLVLDLKPEEDAALRKLLDHALGESFDRLETGVGLIIEEDEHDAVAKAYAKLWPDARRSGW